VVLCRVDLGLLLFGCVTELSLFWLLYTLFWVFGCSSVIIPAELAYMGSVCLCLWWFSCVVGSGVGAMCGCGVEIMVLEL